MSWNRVLSILVAGAVLGLPLHALADNDRHDRGDNKRHDRDDDNKRHDRDDSKRHDRDRHAQKKAERDARYEAELITRYSVLAGSVDNATSLVKGLHNDTTITLTHTTTTTTEPLPCPPPRMPQPPGCGLPGTQTVTVTETFDSPTRPLNYKQIAIALAFMELKLKEGNAAMTAATPAQIKAALVGDTGILTMRAKKMSWGQIAHASGFKLSHVRHQGEVKNHDRDDDDDDDD